jgi:hypothetical protein
VVGNGATATATIAPGPLRAVVLSVRGPHRVRGDLAFLDVKLRDASGQVVGRGSRRLISQSVPAAGYTVAIPGEHLASGAPWTVDVGLRSDARDTATLGATAAGKVSLGVVRPAADGLRLVYADPGAIVYRRLAALPRVRWASRAVTVPNARARRKRLTHGTVGRDTVVLSRPGPAASGRSATVAVKEDSGDRIRAEVTANGSGYLVVADAIQDDWSATVDGRSVQLRDADHALVAVPVPAGQHTIAFSATPRGWRVGIVVSLAALAVLALVCMWGIYRRSAKVDSK